MTRLGAGLANVGPLATDPGLVRQARMAEDRGLGTLHLGDHLLLVAAAQSRYPYASGGQLAAPIHWDRLEALTSATWVLAHTNTINVGTSVLVLPQRNPGELAKVTATLDFLSGGRLFLGVGTGWLAEEQAALGYDFAARRARFIASVRTLRHLWSGSTEQLDGGVVALSEGTYCRPTPRRGGIELLGGGMKSWSLRVAVEHLDGWLAVHRVGESTSSLAALLAEVRAAREREDGNFRAVVRLIFGAERSIEEQAEVALAVKELGFDEVVLDPPWGDEVLVDSLFSRTLNSW